MKEIVYFDVQTQINGKLVTVRKYFNTITKQLVQLDTDACNYIEPPERLDISCLSCLDDVNSNCIQDITVDYNVFTTGEININGSVATTDWWSFTDPQLLFVYITGTTTDNGTFEYINILIRQVDLINTLDSVSTILGVTVNSSCEVIDNINSNFISSLNNIGDLGTSVNIGTILDINNYDTIGRCEKLTQTCI